MWQPIVLCLLFLAHNVRSEVSQGNPVEQNFKDSNDSRIEYLKKMAKDYENLTVDILSVPNVRQGEYVFEELCMQNGGNDSYNSAKRAMQNIKQCFSDIVSYAELPAKIKKSKPYGELDTVFKEYCQKTDDMKICMNKFLVEVDPCLPEHQRNSKFTVQRITDALLKFVCENEGDHIALFISEKGPDCILSKQEGIKNCVQTKTVNNNTNPLFMEDGTRNEGENFNFTAEQERQFTLDFELSHCRMAHQVRKCIVNELTTCSGSTPANVVDSIFNLIQNSTKCSKFSMQEIDPEFSGGTSLFTSMFSVIIPALTVLLVRTFNS